MNVPPIYCILDDGAVADGVTVNTAAIQKTLYRVLASGGGQVVVPPGVFVTGSLVIHSHTDLYLMPGGVLLGPRMSFCKRSYPPGAEPRLTRSARASALGSWGLRRREGASAGTAKRRTLDFKCDTL